MSRSATIPVPIVTENQEGEKLRTTRRQPMSYLVRGRGVDDLSSVSSPEGSVTDTWRLSPLWGSCCLRRCVVSRDRVCEAGAVTPGLLEANGERSSFIIFAASSCRRVAIVALMNDCTVASICMRI